MIPNRGSNKHERYAPVPGPQTAIIAQKNNIIINSSHVVIENDSTDSGCMIIIVDDRVVLVPILS